MLKVYTTIAAGDETRSFIGIEAKGTLPEIAAEFETLVTQLIQGICSQIPDKKLPAARALLATAAVEGAENVLSE